MCVFSFRTLHALSATWTPYRTNPGRVSPSTLQKSPWFIDNFDLASHIQNIDKIFTLIPTYPSTLERSTVGLPRILGVAPTWHVYLSIFQRVLSLIRSQLAGSHDGCRPRYLLRDRQATLLFVLMAILASFLGKLKSVAMVTLFSVAHSTSTTDSFMYWWKPASHPHTLLRFLFFIEAFPLNATYHLFVSHYGRAQDASGSWSMQNPC